MVAKECAETHIAEQSQTRLKRYKQILVIFTLKLSRDLKKKRPLMFQIKQF